MAKYTKRKKQNKKFTERPEVKSLRIPLWERHPDQIALGLIFILLLLFFNQVVFTDKTLLPPDSIASKSFEPFVENSFNRGNYPLWNPYIFGGMPSFASLCRTPYIDIVNTIIYGCYWIFKKVIPLTNFTRLLIEYFLLGSLLYILLRSKKISSSVAFFSVIAMLFLPQVIAYTAFGHSSKLRSVVFIPLIFLLTERLLEKRNLLFFSLTGLAVGFQFLRAHTQISYYTHLMLGVYFIYWAVLALRDEKKISKVFHGGGLLLGAVLLGLLVSSVLNLSVWEYSHYSMRGGGSTGGLDYGYATGWSFPPSEITTYFIPSFMGFGRETYWGPMPFTDFPLYFGLITFLIAGLALIINRNRTTLFFAILSVLVLFISFGKHFPILYGPMFKLLPLFNKFRAPKMVQILLAFSMVILSGFGLQGIIDFKEDKKGIRFRNIKRYLLGFGSVVIILFFVLLFGKETYMNWASRIGQYRSAAYDKALGDSIRALVLFGLSAGLIIMAIRKKINPRGLPFIFGLLLIIDLWTVDRRFVDFRPKTDEASYFSETPEVTYLKKREGHFRILPVGDQRSSNPNWYQYHFLQSAWGYQGAKLRNIQELMDAFGMPNGPDIIIQKYLKIEGGKYAWKRPSEIASRELAAYHTYLKLMNIRYIVSPYPLPDTTLSMVYPPKNRGANGVLEYQDFLQRAYFPKEVITVKGKDAILGFMTSGDFDPATTAIIEEKPPFEITVSDSNKAKIVHYNIHRIELKADVKTPCPMVLSEMYYPAGWTAMVDGEKVKIYKTDYLLRSIFLKPGSHKIEFVFKPKMFRTGLLISVSTFLLLIAGIVIGLHIEKRKKHSQNNYINSVQPKLEVSV